MTFTVLAYDIADDRRRLKVAKLLQGVADRVQHSVFEGYLDERTLKKLLKRLERVIDDQQDSIRVYRVCATCLRQLRILGQGQVEPDQGTIVI